MVYQKAFFDLQLQFADHVSALSGLPVPHVLLDYTNLYVRFGLGRTFDAAHPIWQAYLAGLQADTDARDWTYHFYLTRAHVPAGPSVEATFGCFSYTRLATANIRLHFHNRDTGNHSSLSKVCQAQRQAELKALFRHVQQRASTQVHVLGTSWLYNLEAYRRLFPRTYLATARVVRDRFQSLPLWGQFLDRHGTVKGQMAEPFLTCVERQIRLEHLNDCFPFQMLTVAAPVHDFYEQYGL